MYRLGGNEDDDEDRITWIVDAPPRMIMDRLETEGYHLVSQSGGHASHIWTFFKTEDSGKCSRKNSRKCSTT